MSKQKIAIIICSCAAICFIIAIICSNFLEKGNKSNIITNSESNNSQNESTLESNSPNNPVSSIEPEKDIDATDNVEKTSLSPTITSKIEKTKSPTVVKTTKPTIVPTKKVFSSSNGKYIVAIDAGHQAHQNLEKEPIGPGASTTKAKVSSGTSGVSSGVAECVVTLQVAKKLRDELENRGYSVVMIRESNDVNISNAERAEIANDAGADAFIRIHCNGIDNASVNGAETLCQTKSNPYCGEYYTASRKLSDAVLKNLCNVTSAKNRGVSETDSMSGINWCKVPVTIVEMGFMSNSSEDLKMVDDSYQNKLVKGMADGIDEFFN